MSTPMTVSNAAGYDIVSKLSKAETIIIPFSKYNLLQILFISAIESNSVNPTLILIMSHFTFS